MKQVLEFSSKQCCEGTGGIRRSMCNIVALLIMCSCSAAQQSVVSQGDPVRVLDVGAEPRQRVQYRVNESLVEEIEMKTKLRANNSFTNTVLETGSRMIDFPTTVVRGRLRVSSVTSEGHVLMSFEIRNFIVQDDTVHPGLGQAMQFDSHQLSGVQTTWRLLPSGKVDDLRVVAPNAPRVVGILEQLSWQMFVHFPEVPVGVGAIWEEQSREVVRDVIWDKKTTFTLREMSDEFAVVDIGVTMRAKSQALRIEPNATMRLTSGAGSITAEVRVPRHGLVAAGKADGSTEVNYSAVRKRLRTLSTIRTEIQSSIKRTTGSASP